MHLNDVMHRTRAVVIGGGMAGLCAARALHACFDEVVLLERDACPEGADARPGVPQARHVHALLPRGWIELERLFPGFQLRARAAGGHEIDTGLDFATLLPAGWQRRMTSGSRMLLMSRDGLEAEVRRMLRATPVEIRERVEVTGLLPARGDSARVAGVVARDRDGGAALELPADLVVDASGRTSHAPTWLSALGVRPPQESVVDSFAGYGSRWFRRPDAARWPASWWWKGAWIEPAPPDHLLGGVLFPVEGDRWIATLVGFSRRYPPADEEGFTRALGEIRSPLIAASVALAEPLSPVYASRALSNRFRHYERMPDRIEGFTAIGDSVCVFNPAYGQGMSVAALCATALRDTACRLGPSHPGLGRAFFAAQARELEAPWALAVSADLRFPATEGERTRLAAFLRVYTDRIGAAALDDEVVHRRAMDVYYLLRQGGALFSPGLMARVVAGAARRQIARAARPGPIPPMPPPF